MSLRRPRSLLRNEDTRSIARSVLGRPRAMRCTRDSLRWARRHFGPRVDCAVARAVARPNLKAMGFREPSCFAWETVFGCAARISSRRSCPPHCPRGIRGLFDTSGTGNGPLATRHSGQSGPPARRAAGADQAAGRTLGGLAGPPDERILSRPKLAFKQNRRA